MSAARDDDLAGLLRDHFASEAATLDAAEDWNDLTGRIRTSGRRRVQTVAAAAAVVVLVGVGGGFVWGRSDVGTASNDTAATGRQTAESVLSLPATTSGGDADDTSAGVAELGTPAPVVASPGEATTSEPTSGEATSSQSGADKAAALNGRSVADPGRTSSSGVSLHSWSCTDGSVTIDAATSDTVGRVVVHPEAAGDPNPAGGPALSATATVDGQARPRQLVVVGVYAPGATRLRATFPDGSVDVADVTGPVTALATVGLAQPGTMVRIESVTSAVDRVVAEVTVSIIAGGVGTGC